MLGRVRNTLSGVAPDYAMSSSGYGSNSYSDYGDVYSPTSSHACKYPTARWVVRWGYVMVEARVRVKLQEVVTRP